MSECKGTERGVCSGCVREETQGGKPRVQAGMEPERPQGVGRGFPKTKDGRSLGGRGERVTWCLFSTPQPPPHPHLQKTGFLQHLCPPQHQPLLGRFSQHNCDPEGPSPSVHLDGLPITLPLRLVGPSCLWAQGIISAQPWAGPGLSPRAPCSLGQGLSIRSPCFSWQ